MSSTSDWLRAHPKPRSHDAVGEVNGRRLSESSVPPLRMMPEFFASLEKPDDGAIGVTRIASVVRC